MAASTKIERRLYGWWKPQEQIPKIPITLSSNKVNKRKGLKRVGQERTLPDAQRQEFEDMLHGFTLERSHIKEAMGFPLDNADAAGQIVEVLTESLTLKETPIPAKVEESLLRPLMTSYENCLGGNTPEIEKKASSEEVGGAGVNQDAA
ncbi:hypothetical protein Vadar_032470 [Vaccinium darrowii]|uniref:Uncharacterized protein n=1 Tax=Vaccinium darrowii TaxID=229202 RepID=A0ACB7XLL9_9ERIC|nr:hypothetical protein Vadar_032470 [Vaccinium darrowii]